MPERKASYTRTYIREWREHVGMSQADLAAEVGMDKGNLSKLENGHHPYNQRTLEVIAKALKVSAVTLMTRTPDDPIPLRETYSKAPRAIQRQIDAAAEAIYRTSQKD